MEAQLSYEGAYRAYRGIINHLIGCKGIPNAIAVSLARDALASRDRNQIYLRAQAENLGNPFVEVEPQLQQIREIREKLWDGPDGRHKDNPLPDVYAAAISMITAGWEVDPEICLYRGQRNSNWRVVPSIFRPNADGSNVDVPTRWERVLRFSSGLLTLYPEWTAEQCVAVAQHFSSEARTPTNLVDVTWEPLVGLFFASKNGAKGDIGVLDMIRIREWQNRIAIEPGTPGVIRSINVPGVQRIIRQRALFLETPEPEMYERYCPHRIYFRQVEGLTFWDPEVTTVDPESYLFAIDLAMRELINNFNVNPGNRPTPTQALPPPVQPIFNLEVLHQRALAMRPALQNLTPQCDSVLRAICEVFVQGRSTFGDVVTFSIHQFRNCVEDFPVLPQECTVERALRYSLYAVDRERGQRILDLANEIWAGN